MFNRLSAILFLLPLKFIQKSIRINKSLKWSAGHRITSFLILTSGVAWFFLLKFVFFTVVHDRLWKHLPDDHPAIHKAVNDNAGTFYKISNIM
jgi:hypothetical protein